MGRPQGGSAACRSAAARSEPARRTTPITVARATGAVGLSGKAAANRHIAPPTPKIMAIAQTGAGRRTDPVDQRASTGSACLRLAVHPSSSFLDRLTGARILELWPRRRLSGTMGPMEDGPPTAWICVTCATQFAPSPQPPAECPICLDERQYVGPEGQRWTTLGGAARRAPGRDRRRRARPDRDRGDPVHRDRPARAPHRDPGGQRALGLRAPARRRDRGRGAGARRHRPRSRSPTLTTTRRWSSGAAPSTTRRSTCTPPTAAG